MTTSMTAFARSETDLDGSQLIWEIRSVNHRYLDINLKLPEEFRFLDTVCREGIATALKRGRIDAHLKFEKSGSVTSRSTIDVKAVAALVSMLDQVSKIHPGLQPARTTDILRWPGIISEDPVDMALLAEKSVGGLEDGLSQLVQNRRREGARLAKMIGDSIDQCRELVSLLVVDLENIQNSVQDKWRNRVAEIVKNTDQERIAQEIAILLTKSDVSEELDRLETHLDEAERQLKESKPVGRNLDFLMQELNREANTLGAKSVDPRITNTSIELKVLIDQMREQIQNIE